MSEPRLDVIIVGAGPAGLSAALILGRARRRVLVCDAGHPRNAPSHGLHCYLTRDGIDPKEFLRLGREELRAYETVELRQAEVSDARHLVNSGADHFEVTLNNGERLTSRKLLLATGVTDEVPSIEGLSQFYGTSVFHCPYCDGWEMRDQPLAVYGHGEDVIGLALELTFWTRNLVLCTDGRAELSDEDIRRLLKRNIPLNENRIARLEGSAGVLERIVFANGETLTVSGMFFSTGQKQGSDLPQKLGCKFTEQGCVRTYDYEKTDVPGLYAAGDASRFAQLAIVAASEGALAGVAINKELMKEDLD
jgi:thioredoxin reductase